MRFFKIYGRVLGILGADRKLALLLGFANILVAGLSFLDPLLFGRVIELLTRSGEMDRDVLWSEASQVLGIWLAVGATTIGATIATSLHAERMAHRNRLLVMNRYFGHVLSLPLSPVCSADCSGLCVDCGLRLDDLPEDHTHEITDPRWAGLAERFGISETDPHASSPDTSGDDTTKEN